MMPLRSLAAFPLHPAVLFTALLGACAATPQAPAVPDTLRPPAGQVLTLTTQADGVQIYECQAAAAGTGRYEWVFKAPEATLTSATGTLLGKHYGGPTWEANDGSKVVGEVRARDDGPDAAAIPWLLLGAKSNAGQGTFGRTQSVQRVATSGGKAPASPCTQAEAGRQARVPYRAVYHFYGPKG